MPPRPRSQVTELQAKFVEAKLEGLNDSAAGLKAGATSPSGGNSLAKSTTVRQQLETARRWLTDTTQIKRLDVIEGVIDGIEMARMQGDSGNVIRGWTEVAKILGHYAPEVKRVELSIGQARMRSKFEALSDEELLALSETPAIEGEASRVDH
jgi:hypothetical protein